MKTNCRYHKQSKEHSNPANFYPSMLYLIITSMYRQKIPSPTSVSKKHETPPSFSSTSEQKMMQPSATCATNQKRSSPPPSPRYTGPVSMRRLLAFIYTSVRHIVPFELFGSEPNRRNFLKTVRAVLTAGRLDEVYLKQLMWKTKVTNCK